MPCRAVCGDIGSYRLYRLRFPCEQLIFMLFHLDTPTCTSGVPVRTERYLVHAPLKTVCVSSRHLLTRDPDSTHGHSNNALRTSRAPRSKTPQCRFMFQNQTHPTSGVLSCTRDMGHTQVHMAETRHRVCNAFRLGSRTFAEPGFRH